MSRVNRLQLKSVREVHDVLLRGRELILSPNSWTKRTLVRPGPQYCAMGALAMAYLEPRQEPSNINRMQSSLLRPPVLRARITLEEDIPEHRTITNYNDRISTTHEDIIILYDQAINKCEKRIAQLTSEGEQ